MKRLLIISVGTLLVTVGCQFITEWINSQRLGPAPQFINHPRPELAVDFSAFEKAGCPENEYGNRSCEPDSPPGKLGCTSIQEPASLFGGLEPAYPLAICYVEPLANREGAEPDFPEEGTYFYADGGLFPRYVRYVIYKDGNFELIQNENEFKAIYAPVDSAEEALSFALAVRRVSAYYDLQPDPNLKYEGKSVEDTHVEVTDQGYQVQVYFYQVFGCGPHYTYDVDLLVTNDGDVEELSNEPIFRNPDEDNLCVD